MNTFHKIVLALADSLNNGISSPAKAKPKGKGKFSPSKIDLSPLLQKNPAAAKKS